MGFNKGEKLKEIITLIPAYIIIAVIVFAVNAFQKRKMEVDDGIVIGKTVKIIRTEIKEHKYNCGDRFSKGEEKAESNTVRIYEHDVTFAQINGRLNVIASNVTNTDKNVLRIIESIKKLKKR